MRPRTRPILLSAALLAGLLLPSPGADAGRGFFVQQNLRQVLGSGEPDAIGGFTSYFRTRNDHSTVQGLKVWVQGLSDAEGASLWMGKAGDAETQEIAKLAWTDNGSARFEVVIDSALDDGAVIPLGVESVLRFFGGVVEVRVPGADLVDAPVLRAKVGDFDFTEIDLTPSGRNADLRRAPPPGAVPDETARGSVRLWRKRQAGAIQEGVSLSARGLTADSDYEIWIEDAGGSLVEVGALSATTEGLGYWALNTRYGDTLPAGIGVDTVKDLRRRRIELRRAGFTDYSLAGLFPR
jgi:hypothetical protein